MKKELIIQNGVRLVRFSSDELLITDPQSALDLLAETYEDDCRGIILDKAAIAEPFFVLSSGLAGEVLQKFVNFSKKLAIVGDFSAYTSKPLHDFIYESNRGRTVCFVKTEQEGIDMLAGK